MMRSRLIVPNSLRPSTDGFALSIRLPWYRTLPLSTIGLPVVKLNGTSITQGGITLEVNGKSFDEATLSLAANEWWYVLDEAILRISGTKLTTGLEYDITVEVAFAPPYIPEITLLCGASQRMSLQRVEA